MKRFISLVCAATAILTTAPASATLLDARFSGIVDSQQNTTFATGAAIAGEFIYDTLTNRYVRFNIGGLSVAPGYSSSASITPDLYSALYQAQVSPVLSGGTLNSTFTVDLEALNRWPSGNAVALLLNAAQLATNLDTTLSTFGFYTANADGTNIRSLSANLTSIRVAIPEPETALLLLAGVVAFCVPRLRRLPGLLHARPAA